MYIIYIYILLTYTYIIITTTFVLNVILFPPGELAKGSFFFFFGGGSDMGGIYRVYLRFDFYEPFCTGIHGCLSSLDLFTEMVKQS